MTSPGPHAGFCSGRLAPFAKQEDLSNIWRRWFESKVALGNSTERDLDSTMESIFRLGAIDLRLANGKRDGRTKVRIRRS
jgi:hypothetical protein